MADVLQNTIYTRIVLRNDSSANWLTNESQVLLKGEVGIEFLPSGKVKMKVGDGEKTWAQLSYFGGEDAHVFETEALTAGSDHNEAIAAKVGTTELVAGDIAIVKEKIGTTEKVAYTAYVYNGTAWAAMDGNYSAANVFTNAKITLAGNYGVDSRNDKITSIGNLRIGDTIEAGTSLQAILMDMLSQRLQPSITTNPSATIKLYNGSGTSEVGAVEVGTTITPRFAVSFDDGAYTYESTTGVTASSYSVTSTGRKTVHDATADTPEDASTASSGSFTQFIVDDDTSYKLSVSVQHTAGNIAKDNLGDPSTGSVQIAAGTKTDDSSTVTGYRAWFCGYKNGDNALADATAITGAQVRALGNAANGSWKSSMSVTKMKQMFFAAPAGKGYKPVIKDASTTAPQTVLGPITVSVEGANGFSAIDYDVWYVANADAASGSATLNITKS